MSQKSPFQSRVKIFADGADLNSMIELSTHPLVKGFTTNPTLMKAAGVKDYKAFAHKVLSHIHHKPISFEVFADEFGEMKRQGLEIKSWGKNVNVKIPVTNSEGQSSMELVHELSHKGVQLNVTAIFTLDQVWEVCQALKGGAPAIVSVFAGRIADTGRDPAPLMQAALEMCRATDSNIELLWASPREAWNIVQADTIGVDIITITLDQLKKTSLFNKDLRQFSLETVKMFKKDAEAAGFQL
jgi:transaldolase